MAYPTTYYDFGGGVTRPTPTQIVTIASGVATVSEMTPVVALAAESSTTDQLDTLTVTGAKQGDTIMLVADTGDTITVDDANIDLSAATIVLSGVVSLVLWYNGTGWSEVTTSGTVDNVT